MAHRRWLIVRDGTRDNASHGCIFKRVLRGNDQPVQFERLKAKHFKMGRACNARHSHIRIMCGRVWASDLEKLSVEVLCRKLHFFLLHCDISNIYYMYSIGLFHNRDVLSIVVSAIKQRNDHTDPLAKHIIHRHRKYIYTLV